MKIILFVNKANVLLLQLHYGNQPVVAPKSQTRLGGSLPTVWILDFPSLLFLRKISNQTQSKTNWTRAPKKSCSEQETLWIRTRLLPTHSRKKQKKTNHGSHGWLLWQSRTFRKQMVVSQKHRLSCSQNLCWKWILKAKSIPIS